MRSLSWLFGCVLGLFVLASCNNSDDDSNVPAPQNGQVTASIDGQVFTSDLVLTAGAFSSVLDNKTLAIVAPSSGTGAPGTLSFSATQQNGDNSECVPTGSYSLNIATQMLGTMAYELGGTTYSPIGTGVQVFVGVTECDEAGMTISGTFSGILRDGTTGPSIAIEDGRFERIPFVK